MSATEKNFKAVQQALTKVNNDNMVLTERVQRLEGNVTFLQSELANLKQLVGHTLGRGMGSTKHD